MDGKWSWRQLPLLVILILATWWRESLGIALLVWLAAWWVMR